MTRFVVRMCRVAAGVLAVGLAACSQHPAVSNTASAPQVVDKSFTLTAGTPLHVDFLVGQLQDLKVTESVEAQSGKVTQAPELRGTLKITNGSKDQAAQLLGGKLVFLDAQGQPIPLAKDQDTSLTFNTYDTPRLDPGQEKSTTIDVPFPSAGLQTDAIKSVRVDLTYLPTPYRSQTATAAVELKAG